MIFLNFQKFGEKNYFSTAKFQLFQFHEILYEKVLVLPVNETPFVWLAIEQGFPLSLYNGQNVLVTYYIVGIISPNNEYGTITYRAFHRFG